MDDSGGTRDRALRHSRVGEIPADDFVVRRDFRKRDDIAEAQRVGRLQERSQQTSDTAGGARQQDAFSIHRVGGDAADSRGLGKKRGWGAAKLPPSRYL